MRKNVQLVMPMCGRGSRFFVNDIRTPKPLINIFNKPFFYWSTMSLINLFNSYYSLTFVVLMEHVENFQIDKCILSFFPKAKLVILPDVPNGPVFTCLEACIHLNKNYPVIFNDCDHAFLYEGKICNDNSFLLCFESNNPNFSFIKLNNKNQISLIAEKQVLSNEAICGAYYFDSVNTFEVYANRYISLGKTERFMSGVVNLLCKEKRVDYFMLKQHVSFGTPEEYEVANSSAIFEELENASN